MLKRPRCFVTTAVLFLNEQFKKKEKRVRSQTVPLSGQKKDDPELGSWLPRSHISDSAVVCSDRVTL